MNYFKGFGSGFTDLQANPDAGMLLGSAVYRKRNETRSRRSTRVKTRVHSAVSSVRLMQ
jgi:hypothetical protein